MTPGDLIQYGGKRWLVGLRHREVRTFTIYDSMGLASEIPDDADKTGECKVLCNPSKDWPVVIIKARPTAIIAITDLRTGRILDCMGDWAPGNPGRPGGNFFVNPLLGLRIGDTLLITYANGKGARFVIPRIFATVQQKISQAAAKPKEPKTIFDHMMEDDEADPN